MSLQRVSVGHVGGETRSAAELTLILGSARSLTAVQQHVAQLQSWTPVAQHQSDMDLTPSSNRLG
jgi:hypothetical protein